MAYCKKCGAYIPDGQTKCLACGYDEAEDRKKTEYSGGFAAEYSREKEEMERRRREREKERREYDARRRAQQEENRKWAEEERRRRNEQRAAQGRPVNFNNSYRQAEPMQHKALALLSYFSILFILPRILCPDDKFARFHAKQGMALFIFGVLCDFLTGLVPPIGGLLSLLRVYCVFKGAGNAMQGREEPLPFIGKYVN